MIELEKYLILPDMPLPVKIAILEGLGHSQEPYAGDIFVSSLTNEEDSVAGAAVRGLSEIGEEASVSTLSDLLFSTNAAQSVVGEAAVGLAKIDHPEALDILFEAYKIAAETGNTSLVEDIFEAMGYRDIAETGEFYYDILNDKTTPSEMKVAVLEAMENAEGDTSPILLDALGDEDSQVRAKAAWAIAMSENPGDFSPELEANLRKEPDPEVRKRLYQALSEQENVGIADILPNILAESDPGPMLAGYDLWAGSIRSSKDGALSRQFDQTAVPRLRDIALSGSHLNQKIGAIIPLRKAGTDKSKFALQEIHDETSDSRVKDATGIH